MTRYELAVTLDRLVRDIEAAHKPLSAAPDLPVRLSAGMPAGAATALTHLVGGGFLPRELASGAQGRTGPVTAARTG